MNIIIVLTNLFFMINNEVSYYKKRKRPLPLFLF